jgi:hypothetical protein
MTHEEDRLERLYAELARGNCPADQDARRELARCCGYRSINWAFGTEMPTLARRADGSSVLTEDGLRRVLRRT